MVSRNPYDTQRGDTPLNDSPGERGWQPDRNIGQRAYNFGMKAVGLFADIVNAATFGLAQPITGAIYQGIDMIGQGLGLDPMTPGVGVGDAFNRGLQNIGGTFGRMSGNIDSDQALSGALLGGMLGGFTPLSVAAGMGFGAFDKSRSQVKDQNKADEQGISVENLPDEQRSKPIISRFSSDLPSRFAQFSLGAIAGKNDADAQQHANAQQRKQSRFQPTF